MDDSNIIRLVKEQKEKLEKLSLKIERNGIRLLTAYQCIYCGKIFDDYTDIVPHIDGRCIKGNQMRNLGEEDE